MRDAWLLPLLLVAIATVALFCGLMAHLGWRLAGRLLPRPAGTAASIPPRQPEGWTYEREDVEDCAPLPGGVSGWSLTSPLASSGRPDWAADTPVLPGPLDYTPYWPSYRSDRALQ